MQTTETLDSLLYKVTSMFSNLNNTISDLTLEKLNLNNENKFITRWKIN